MWWWIAIGGAAAAVALYELVANAAVEPPRPSPRPRPAPREPGGGGLLNVKPPRLIAVAPSQGTATPHTVPGGGFVYTGAQGSAAELSAAAKALAAVDPTKRENQQLVRNFQDAAGLAQRPGGPGWELVHPTGTDGRYGHDVAALLGKYVSNPPPPSSTRPWWWGAPSRYDNR